MWSEVEQRIEPAIAALPGLVERAARSGRAEELEAVRARAADALGEMQATVRTLGSTEPLEPLAPEETTLRRLAEVLAEHGPVDPRGGVDLSGAARARASLGRRATRTVVAPGLAAPARRAPSSRPPAPPTTRGCGCSPAACACSAGSCTSAAGAARPSCASPSTVPSGGGCARSRRCGWPARCCSRAPSPSRSRSTRRARGRSSCRCSRCWRRARRSPPPATLAVAVLAASAADLLAPYAVTPDFVASLHAARDRRATPARAARSPAW